MGLSRDRCCVAVPLYNVGVYAILAQFAVISIVTAVLSFAAPYIVAVSIPSFGSYLLGGICCVLFGLQGWGFFGVYKEKPATFRKYVAANTIVLVLAFIMALVWIILSIVKHNTAVEACIEQFITETENSGTTTSGSTSEVNVTQGSVSGKTLCSVFTWVQTGIMGGLWLALLIIESYFAIVSRIYGSEQREDHRRYNSVYTEARQSIMRQSMLWENGRLSSDGEPLPPAGLGHGRNMSRSSALRNEVKGDDDDQEEQKGDYSVGNVSAGEGYLDAPLYTSPTKGTQPYGVNAYAHNYTNSRSNLAPVDSNSAYMHSRNGSNLSYGQHQQQDQGYGQYQHHHQQQQQYRNDNGQTYDQGGRYDHDAADDFTGYYAR